MAPFYVPIFNFALDARINVNESESPTAGKRTMLIVDDQHSVCVSLAFLLRPYNYQVVTAESGPAAVVLYGEHVIDGAVIDIHMPGMNGFETFMALQAKAKECGRPLRAWFMTGAPTRLIETRAAEIGGLALLGKPFDFPAILSVFDVGFALPPAALERHSMPAVTAEAS